MECKTDDDFSRAVAARQQGVSNVVQVTLPAEVYFNLDRFQEAQRLVLGRLGHMACVSGWDIRFDMVRQFALNEKLQFTSVGGFGG